MLAGMASVAQAAFADMQPEDSLRTGLFPSQYLMSAIHNSREIEAAVPIADDQIQPASLDLRLGAVGYRVPASFLPGSDSTVRAKIDEFAMYQIDLSEGTVLERDSIYVVELIEHLALRKRTSALANSKSSIGRLDILFLITDYGAEFDRVPANLSRPALRRDLAPHLQHPGNKATRVNQIRIKPARRPSDDAMRRLNQPEGLLDSRLRRRGQEGRADHGRPARARASAVIGYAAKGHAGLIDVDLIRDAWRTIGTDLFPRERRDHS